MNKSKRWGSISMILAAVLIFAVIFNVVYTGGLDLGKQQHPKIGHQYGFRERAIFEFRDS